METQEITTENAETTVQVADGGEEKKLTTYVILSSIDGVEWTQEGTQEATSRPNACSRFYETNPLPGGAEKFQAVPVKSWKVLGPSNPRPRLPFAEVE